MDKKISLNVIKYILTLLIVCYLILGLGLVAGKIISKIIKMEHPFPTLSKNLPIVERLDEMLCLSANIEWYKCKDKITGEEYLVFTSDYPYIKIMNYKTRDEFITITRNEFLRRFGQPYYGVGYKTEEEALK